MDYRLKLTKFSTEDNLILPALLYEPISPTETVAIFLHGNGTTSAIASPDKCNIFGEIFIKHNIAYFPFNNRGAQLINKLKWYENGIKKEYKCGTAYELIRDCIKDIDGAIAYLSSLGYKQFILVGDSTGSNKACLYSYYKPENKISKYILLEGGDDTGIYYNMIGPQKFPKVLAKCKEEIEKGNGLELVSKRLIKTVMSYQSLYDTINPDGDYNVFSYNEYMNELHLAKKELFREFKTIQKPTLVIYGENDEYCYGNVPKCIEILKQECASPHNFVYKIVPQAPHGFSGFEHEVAQIISAWLS